MKLAIVSPYPPEISGIGQYGARMAEGLARSGRFAEVRVFTHHVPDAPALERKEGLTVQRTWWRGDRATMWVIPNAIAAWQPDLVWFNLGLSVFGRSRADNFLGLLSPMLVRLAGMPTVVTLHEIFEAVNLRALGAVNGRLTRWGGAAAMHCLLRADAVCLTLSSYIALIEQRYGARNLVHIPHGAYDTPAFTPLPREQRILMFATHAPYKGLPELIDIFRGVRAAGSEALLTVAGSDHPRFPGYLQSVQSAAGHVPGLEWRIGVPESRIPDLFARARVVALPVRATTGASSVVHRAAAHGRPVVVYDLPDLRVVAAEENLRFDFVPAYDSAAFGARLRYLLDHPAECERIGQANVAAMQNNTLEMTCRRYVRVFESVVGRQVTVGDAVAT